AVTPTTACSTLSLHDALPICHSYKACWLLPEELHFHFTVHGVFNGFSAGRRVANGGKYRLLQPLALLQRRLLRVWVLIPSSFLRSEEHTSELQSRFDLVCRLL